MRALHISHTWGRTWPATLRHMPDNLDLQKHCCQNLKPQMVMKRVIQYKVGHFLTYWATVRDVANLAHDVGQDGAWWTNESTNYCHEVIVEHKPFCTKSPAWVAVEHGDNHRHVSTCEHSAANCNQSLFTSIITVTNKCTYDWKSYITFKILTCFSILRESKTKRLASSNTTLLIWWY